jgi:hypothetical protein
MWLLAAAYTFLLSAFHCHDLSHSPVSMMASSLPHNWITLSFTLHSPIATAALVRHAYALH